jgi:hypothetical protein
MRPRTVAITALVAATLECGGGCGAHTSFREGVYHASNTSYRLGPLPPRWKRHQSDADVAFYDTELDAIIMVGSECPDERDAPLSVAANTLLIGFTDRQTVAEEVVPLAGREALHRRVRAKLDGAPLALDLYVLKKDGCLYDLVYLAPPENAARGEPDFRRLVAGFQTMGDGERLARSKGPP